MYIGIAALDGMCLMFGSGTPIQSGVASRRTSGLDAALQRLSPNPTSFTYEGGA